MTGRCPGTQACCVTAADCPAGEGCCGNKTRDVGEECDDGNSLDLDCCSSRCKIEPAGSPGKCDDGSTACTTPADCGGGLCHQNCEPQVCAVFGPHLVSAAVKRTLVTDKDASSVSERWSTSGYFILNPGQTVDPDSETVMITFSEGATGLYSATLEPTDCPPNATCFVQKGPDTCTKQWKYTDREADVASALGWRSGKFTQKKAAVGGCGNRVDFNLKSGPAAAMTTPVGTRFRQSIQIGDDCATAILACSAVQENGVNRKLKCTSTSP